MDISIVVPYHGEDTYLKDCLLSLAEQTVTNFEVILVASGTDIPEVIQNDLHSTNILPMH